MNENEKELVWEAIKNKLTTEEISQKLGHSIEETKKLIDIVKFEQETRIIELLNRGLNKRAIASVLNCSVEVLEDIIRDSIEKTKKEYFESDPEELMILEIKRMENMATTAFRQYTTAEDPKLKLQYLQIALESLKSKHLLLQKIGVLPK